MYIPWSATNIIDDFAFSSHPTSPQNPSPPAHSSIPPAPQHANLWVYAIFNDPSLSWILILTSQPQHETQPQGGAGQKRGHDEFEAGESQPAAKKQRISTLTPDLTHSPKPQHSDAWVYPSPQLSVANIVDFRPSHQIMHLPEFQRSSSPNFVFQYPLEWVYIHSIYLSRIVFMISCPAMNPHFHHTCRTRKLRRNGKDGKKATATRRNSWGIAEMTISVNSSLNRKVRKVGPLLCEVRVYRSRIPLRKVRKYIWKDNIE